MTGFHRVTGLGLRVSGAGFRASGFRSGFRALRLGPALP